VSLFIGTLIIVGLSCLVMSLGVLLGGKPLSGGCGKAPGKPQCQACPRRKEEQASIEDMGGEPEC